MNIYIVEADEKYSWWDQYDAFVIFAESEDEALRLALDFDGFDPNNEARKQFYIDKWTTGKVVCIGTANEGSKSGVAFESCCNS